MSQLATPHRGVSKRSAAATSFLPAYKVLLLGDAAVGKSNLISRFTGDVFDPTSPSTIGVEFISREVDLSCAGATMGENFSPVSRSPNSSRDAAPETSHDKSKVVMQLWDTAGQDNHSVLASAYFRGAKGAAVVYDVTRKSSLLSVGRWVAKAREYCDADCTIVIIGNKTDLRHNFEVDMDEADAFCHSLGCRHFLASALSGEGVQYAFIQLLLSVHAVAMSSGVANSLPTKVALTNRNRASTDDLLLDGSGVAISGFKLPRNKSKRDSKCCMKR